VALACAGGVIGIAAMVSFWRAKTTMNPIKPGAASLLVTGGVFRFTRNPMYLSLPLYLLAWGPVLVKLAGSTIPAFVRALHQSGSNHARGAHAVTTLRSRVRRI
jgi:protein-S-isoprenylcysteine O-methyltransferase Ste14